MLIKSALQIEHYEPVFAVKAAGALGLIEGYASTFGGEPDEDHDLIAPGAFGKSLSDHRSHGTMPAMLWGHDQKQPIGKWTKMVEDAHGLKVQGKLTLDVPRAKEAFALAKDGAIAFSIGYRPEKMGRDASNARILQSVNLLEVSLVAIPANRNARLTSVKSVQDIKDPRAFEEFLRDAGFPRAFAKAVTASGFKAATGQRDVEGVGNAELARMIRDSASRLSKFTKG